MQAPIEHLVLNDLLIPVKELLEDVRRKALMRLEYEGLHQTEAISTPGARFYNDPSAYAMDRYAYYVCYKCNKVSYKNVFAAFDALKHFTKIGSGLTIIILLGLLWWRGSL